MTQNLASTSTRHLRPLLPAISRPITSLLAGQQQVSPQLREERACPALEDQELIDLQNVVEELEMPQYQDVLAEEYEDLLCWDSSPPHHVEEDGASLPLEPQLNPVTLRAAPPALEAECPPSHLSNFTGKDVRGIFIVRDSASGVVKEPSSGVVGEPSSGVVGEPSSGVVGEPFSSWDSSRPVVGEWNTLEAWNLDDIDGQMGAKKADAWKEFIYQ